LYFCVCFGNHDVTLTPTRSNTFIACVLIASVTGPSVV